MLRLSVHVGSMKSLVTSLDFELDFLTFSEGLEAVHRDCREVNEDVFTTLLLNEAITLRVVEPLHFSSGHGTASGIWIPVRAYIESARIFVKQFGPDRAILSVNQNTCVYCLKLRLARRRQTPSPRASLIVKQESDAILTVFPVLHTTALSYRRR